MKKIDNLIKSARLLLKKRAAIAYPSDEDGFMKALGVKLSSYAVELSDGTVGYDVLRALNDTALIDWADEL